MTLPFLLNVLALVLVLPVMVLLWSSPALANAGTPLMWTGLLHLSVGNLFLGYVEAGLLSRLWEVPRGRSLS